MSDATDNRRPWIVLALFGVLGSLAIWRHLVAPETAGGDASHYLAHAWALAEGRPYGDTGYLFRPGAWIVGPPVQPPGLPVLLAPLLAVFGRYSAAPAAVMYVLFGGFLVAVFARLRRSETIADAAGATLVAGAALALADVPQRIGSDLGYMMFVWITIGLADRWARADAGDPARRARRLAPAALTGGLALAFRLAAIPLIPAAALWSLVGRRRDGWRWAWAGIAVFWLAVFAGLYLGAGAGRSPGTAMGTSPGMIDLGAGPARLGALGRIAHNLPLYRYSVLEALLYPFPGTAGRVYHVVALLLVTLGAGLWLRSGYRSFLAAFTLMTAGFLALAPVADGRYLWVLYPMIGLGLVRGIRWVAARLWARRPGEIVLAVVFVLILLSAGVRAARPVPEYAAEPKAVLWSWAGDVVREDADSVRVASNRPRHLAWYADVPAAFLSPRDTADLAGLRPTHLVFDRRAFEDDGPRGAVFPDPGRLGTVLGERGPLVVIRRPLP